jgi:hypothetical protein
VLASVWVYDCIKTLEKPDVDTQKITEYLVLGCVVETDWGFDIDGLQKRVRLCQLRGITDMS